MKTQPSYGSAPLRRELIDNRSTKGPVTETRKTLLNDRRSTR